MSEFKIEVVQIGDVEKHSGADTLSITHVHGGYPVIFRTGDFQPGDLAVYIPVDSVVPSDDARWAFLDGRCRIKAKRLRGIFSMGLLTKSDSSWTAGQDVREALRIVKYEPPEPMTMGGENEPDPGFLPIFTDIEALRRWPDILQTGEEVFITEKIHGANARFLYRDGRLWVGSHTQIKKLNVDKPVVWWQAALKYELEDKLKAMAGFAFYGEVYGFVQDLRYGATPQNKVMLRIFDVLDTVTRRYMDAADFYSYYAPKVGLPVVPVLYHGPWQGAQGLAEGKTLIDGADHVREGVVIRPAHERFDDRLGGRVILKIHGEGFLLRQEK